MGQVMRREKCGEDRWEEGVTAVSSHSVTPGGGLCLRSCQSRSGASLRGTPATGVMRK